jgi:hypothetical protein
MKKILDYFYWRREKKEREKRMEIAFLRTYDSLERKSIPALTGHHFNAEQWADLMRVVLYNIRTFQANGDEKNRDRWIDWASSIMVCRRSQRFYSKILYKHLKGTY